MGLQALAEFESAALPVPTAPSQSASAPSPLALALSSAYTTLPADLFYSVLQSTVLPHLERLAAIDQDAIRKAFESATKEESEQSFAGPDAFPPTPSQSDPREDDLRRRVEELNQAQMRENPSKSLRIVRDLLDFYHSLPDAAPSATWASATAAKSMLESAETLSSPALLLPFFAVLRLELLASAAAIHAACSLEFPHLQSALASLQGSEHLLAELPEVQLGAAGWQEKEKQRRLIEMEREELLDTFADKLRPAQEEEVASGVWSGLADEVVPSDEDRRLGNRLLSWVKVWRAWPDRVQAEGLMLQLRETEGEFELLRQKAVVEVMCSMVRKSRPGYDPEATSLRDGMWVLMNAWSREDGGRIERFGQSVSFCTLCQLAFKNPALAP